MDITVFPRKLNGIIPAIPSKSQAHRLLICAAFADCPTELLCPQTNQDIEATAMCLQALGADIRRTAEGYYVIPVKELPGSATLPCRESGSTLRFMLPIVGALGINATFLLEGRLPQRPLSPLWEEMVRMGCQLSRPTASTITCSGKLRCGNYCIDGSISSQFITGLLFAITLMQEQCTLTVNGKLESKPYVDMTLEALRQFGVESEGLAIKPNQRLRSPGTLTVEGDWSNGAFFLAAQRIGSQLTVTGLNPCSSQGDRQVQKILETIDSDPVIDAANIPDLVPILSIAAACFRGAVFTNITRLRLKESDRVSTVVHMLQALGADAEATDNTLRVYPGEFHSCLIDSHGDHRIAMSAAVAATAAAGPVIIRGADCVAKSYPSFWDDYSRLGGLYEQYIR